MGIFAAYIFGVNFTVVASWEVAWTAQELASIQSSGMEDKPIKACPESYDLSWVYISVHPGCWFKTILCHIPQASLSCIFVLLQADLAWCLSGCHGTVFFLSSTAYHLEAKFRLRVGVVMSTCDLRNWGKNVILSWINNKMCELIWWHFHDITDRMTFPIKTQVKLFSNIQTCVFTNGFVNVDIYIYSPVLSFSIIALM